MADIPVAAIEAFKTTLRGQVMTDNDPGYDDARRIWNAMIDRYPAVIVRCAGVADVLSSLSFAREHQLPIAIRGGGHNIAGSAICTDGLVLDMSTMKSVRIDPDAQRAYVEPGATLADFDHEAQAFGLATPLGINSTTGVAGLTLGGGFGWLSRRYGMTIDNLISADVVTADGKLVHASASSHPDLFWALRGGGGNFGVVTLFEFQLHRVGTEVFGGLIVFPLDQAQAALRKYQGATPLMPDDLTVWAVLRLAPPLPFLPPEVHGQPIVAFAVCHTGAATDQADINALLRGFGTPLGEHLGAMPYSAWQQAFDALLMPGARNYWKSHNLATLSEGLIDAVIDAVHHLPSPQCEIFFGQIGGQTARPAADAMAYSARSTQYAMNVHSRWDDAKDDSACIAWARDFFQAAAPHAMGSVYVNFMTEEEAHRVKAAYGDNFDRLAHIKGRYDPQNLFRNNQNIQPFAAAPGSNRD
ncbi:MULTISPECIES: FAD-binding oxidoreductase [unclassified Achromobacter]|uniref:FAD-binding oxidoreductase n=1 Tax=unclassified Achromobacter TaxID=2626865 RepID=UPI000B51A688|nr:MULTISPECIES: FAD-binding oxidoreductase [unclassified Achromobacter]OWT75010.1 FAD-linked oxidase [Achromobacter sp. HZ28]OWT76619.1 FAD-linked oxidase [Achromobacter sp. HZ34]